MTLLERGNPSSLLLPLYVKVSVGDSPSIDKERSFMAKSPRASIYGSLMYAIVATSLDIAFIVLAVSKFMANPSRKHSEAASGILQCLKCMKH